MLETVIYDLMTTVIQNIDFSIIDVNSRLILLSIDMADLLSQHIASYSVKLKQQFPSEDEDQNQGLEEEMKKQFQPNKKNLPNLLRKLILRLQPYMTPTTKP